MQRFYYDKRKVLKVILLPRYSPYMNPQENIWNHLKTKIYRPSARSSIYELIVDIQGVFHELNSNTDKICSLAYGKKFLV